MPRSCDPEYWPVVQRAKRILSIYGDMEELIRLGAYRTGSNPETDEAIRLFPQLEAFLAQGKEEATNLGEGYRQLAQIVGTAPTES
jgi:flagellum-specific ATP synthase